MRGQPRGGCPLTVLTDCAGDPQGIKWSEPLELAALVPRVAGADEFCVAGRSYSVKMEP